MLARLFAVLVTGVAATNGSAHTPLACNGYNVSINDHVEHIGKIIGNSAMFDDKQYRVIRTAREFILVRHGSEIRINRVSGKYVMYGPKGRKAPATEYSEPGGGGCLGDP
jgi:hypothetical protein